MKTLGKLKINSENVLNDDELKNLKGGLWMGTCWVFDGEEGITYGDAVAGSCQEAEAECENTYRPLFGPDLWCTCV